MMKTYRVDTQLAKDFPNVKIIFCPQIAINLQRYNKMKNAHPKQHILIESVFAINTLISDMNKRQEF